MRLYRCLRDVLLGMIAVFAILPHAFAEPASYVYRATQAFSDHGYHAAKFEAERSFMFAIGQGDALLKPTGLRHDSHGYLQASADDYEGLSPIGSDQLSQV